MLNLTRSLTALQDFVWDQDPALVKGEGFEEAWKKHVASGKAEDLRSFVKEGSQLTIFRIAPLSRKQWLHVGSLQGMLSDYEAVAGSLRDIQGLELNGSPVQLVPASDIVEVQGMKRLKAEFLDQIYDPFLFRAIATRVIEISRLDPTRGQG